MRIAIVTDYLNVYGGAERTLEAILEIYPEADVFTSLYDPSKFRGDSPIRRKHIGSVFRRLNLFQRFNLLETIISFLPKHFTFIFPYFFERLDLSGYDLVISLGTIWAKGIKTDHSHQKHIFYCLTPPRFLYGYPSETSKRNVWYYRPFTTILGHWLRIWDFNTAQKPGEIISISQEVQRRVKKFYRRNSLVIYPPVSPSMTPTTFFRHPDPAEPEKDLNSRDSSGRTPQNDEKTYFLIVSRLAAYKGIDLAIKACNELKLPLKIVGTGREEAKLRSIAGPTVEFLGFKSDAEVDELYKGARALIFPTADEDFGIVPLEANAHGVPVICRRSGGPLETMVEGKTTVFFKDFEELKGLLRSFDASKFSPEDCVENAQRFNKERFQKEFKELVDETE